MLGYPTNKNDVDIRAGQTSLTLRNVLADVKNFKAWMDTQTDAQLIALGYVQAEVNTLRSAFVDLDKLRTVYEGTATQATTYDFRTFAKLVTGAN